MRIAIAHFVIDTGLGAGMAVKTVAVSRALAAAGESVLLITTDVGLSGTGPPVLPGVQIVVLPATLPRFPVPRVSHARLVGLLQDCDVVLLMNHWTAMNAMLFRAIRRLGLPFALCPSGALTIHGRSRLLKRAYQTLIGGRLIRHAGAVLATTELEAAQLRAFGVAPAKIVVIPNGVDGQPGGLSGAAFRAARGLPANPFVLFVGRLNPIKGPDLLIEAFARISRTYPEWHLVLAGPDEGLQSQLAALATRLGVADRIHFSGLLDPNETAGAYRAASLLAVPSRHEAMSQVALEAAVLDTPVLLTDACGFDAVEQAGGGRVVPATVDGLTAGLADLLSRPEALRAMGERLHEVVARAYGWPTVAPRYVEVLGTLAGRASVSVRKAL